VVLAAAVVAAFLPVSDNGFVQLDDDKNFLKNPFFRGLSREQVAWAWTTRLVGVYQPLGWMVLEAQYSAWGLDPRGYHLASLALHALITVALYALTVALIARCRPDRERDDPLAVRAGSCLAVGLFAVHPIRVEAVAWASCQTYLPCALFSILAVLAYLRAHVAPPRVSPGWLAGAWLLSAAALLSKAVAVTLPVVLLILDVYPLRRLGPGRWLGPAARRVYREKVPFAILSAVFIGLAVWARSQSVVVVPGYTAATRGAMACYGVWFYLVKTAVPVGLTPSYPIPLRVALTEPRLLASALGILAATAGLVVIRRSWPGVLAAWAVYLVMLAPSTGLIPKGGPCIAADRYCFVPMMGLVVLAGGALAGVLRVGRFPPALASSVLIGGLVAGVALGVRTRAQCRTWRDSVALWSHALAVSTEPNPLAYHGLGLVRAGEPGGLTEAERLIGEEVRLIPEDPTALNAMTLVLGKQGRIDEALAYNLQALRVAPRNVRALVNLGNIRARQGHPDQARSAYEQALRFNPLDSDAHLNLGLVLLGQGRSGEAEAHLTEALRLNPDAARARLALEDLRRRSRPASPRDPPW
jgi:hypothetical protein